MKTSDHNRLHAKIAGLARFSDDLQKINEVTIRRWYLLTKMDFYSTVLNDSRMPTILNIGFENQQVKIHDGSEENEESYQ